VRRASRFASCNVATVLTNPKVSTTPSSNGFTVARSASVGRIHDFLSGQGNLTGAACAEMQERVPRPSTKISEEVLVMFDTTLPQNEDIQTPGPATDDQADNVGLFLREIHHRLKNTLTLLGSWLRAYLRSTTSVNLPMARRIASSAHPWKA
jgi:hypothetical protein